MVLGLDGAGGAERFADYSQWENWVEERRKERKNAKSASSNSPVIEDAKTTPPLRKKLSYLDNRDYQTIEDRIADAEQALAKTRAKLEDPAITSDGAQLMQAYSEVEAAEKAVNDLYARWAELEEKLG